jgi:pimeloyl-ACP methyl ester carboxylesterase
MIGERAAGRNTYSSSMTVVLVHSPLVGPLTWRAVADELTRMGHDTVVPANTFSNHTDFVRSTARQCPDGPVVLVGHSGAGLHLPAIASLLPGTVQSLIYVDARLPQPGEPPMAHLPPQTVAHLKSLVHQGMLPPWNEWFPPGTLEEALPDPRLRSAFLAELHPIPFSYYTEPPPTDRWHGPASYLLLSEPYRVHAQAAERSGATVAELIDHHLAMLTAPAAVATALHRLLS